MKLRSACAAALLVLAGCSSGPPTIGDPAPALTDVQAEQAYQALLARYTGRAEIYSGFDTQLFAGATYQSWAFREARVKRLAAFRAMTADEIAAMLVREREDHQKHHEFILGTWVVEPRFDDFDKRDSVWRTALVVEGGEVLPIDVQRISRVTHDVRALYPYMGAFWVHYRVQFPTTRADGSPVIPPGTKTVKLTLASSLGKAELITAAE
ncbi:MAG: hypothetical protein WBV82_19230 [Myxococcaceae bacterium]